MLTEDLYRKYVDRAIVEASLYKSAQTNYLHFHADCYEGSVPQACPTEANLLFALLLLRKKTHESIQEGKDRLAALLSFQNVDPSLPQYGNFPPYLTGFPLCEDWVVPIRIALIFRTALHYFSSVLGQDLEHRLKKSIDLLLAITAGNMTKIRFPNWALVLDAIVRAKPQEEILLAIDNFFSNLESISPDSCGKVIAACSICNIDLYSYALQKVRALWNGSTYVGPPWGLFSYQAGAEITLGDLMMESCQSLISKPWPLSTALDCALLPPDTVPMMSDIERRSFLSGSVRLWQEKDLSFSVALCRPKMPGLYGFYPIRIATSQATLCCTTPGGQVVDLTIHSGTMQCTVAVEQIGDDDPSILRLWIERKKGIAIRLDGKIGSVFDPHTGIQITDGKAAFGLTFDSSLTLIGRIGLGNRPSQLCRNKKGPSEAYDWKVCIECLRGDLPASLTMRLEPLS